MPDISSNRVAGTLDGTNGHRPPTSSLSVHQNGSANGHAQLHIIIVGAGLGGLASAISCSLAGHAVTVLEAAVKLGEVGAGIQLTPNVTRLMKRWGLFPRLEPLAVEPRSIYFRRWSTGEAIGLTRLVPDFEQAFGSPYWVVHRAHLHEALLDRAKELGAAVHVNSRTRETTYSADLILGCDGLKSVTRSHFLNGNDPGPSPSPYCAYRATVPMELLKADPELAPLVEHADLSVWIGDRRHVMSYPINGGKTFNMVLSHPDTTPAGKEWTADPAETLEEMRQNYKGWDPRLTKIISLIETTNKWKLMTYEKVSNWRHESGKFVLMGDACHAMLPYMSQGAAQAIEDAAALGRCLARYSGPESLPVLTRCYQDIRFERAYAVQYKSALNGRIWHYPDGEDQELRDAGMAASLGNEHYIRSTNQWSDPATQIWLYNHDAEAMSDTYLDEKPDVMKRKQPGLQSGREEMIACGLLAA
ncbi:hypothetical protein P7C73_g1701, partial [Tremellales sp. Uapishka_1]